MLVTRLIYIQRKSSRFLSVVLSPVDCEQSLIFARLLHANPKHVSGKLSRETTSWFAIALDEIRTRRILREKADCKQSISPVPRSPLGTPRTMADHNFVPRVSHLPRSARRRSPMPMKISVIYPSVKFW